MSILNIPIQINGGTDKNSTDKNQLKPRELYINTNTYRLYCGNDEGVPTAVRCMYADNAVEATKIGNSDSFININANNDINTNDAGARIGNIIFYKNRCEPKSNNVVTLKDFNIENVKYLTLSSNIYGKNTPTNAVNGQVFFLV